MKQQQEPIAHQDNAVRVNDLVELLRMRAEEQPRDIAYRFLSDGQAERAQLSFGELDQRARAIAAHLQTMSLTGQRALLLYPPGLPYIEAFFGCLYAGVVAVPAYPPSRHHLNRLQRIVADAALTAVMATEELQEKLLAGFSEHWGTSRFQWLVTDTLDIGHSEAWRPPTLIPESLAFLQYTSGSTGHPKGVMVSHQNLLANQHAIKESFHHTEKTRVVGWLPLYHDMGLIGNILQPLYLGTQAILMPPLTFMEQPVRWLQAISQYRATTSGGPNFAYELCLRRITAEQKRDLDLRTWTVAFNGAEPVRATTIERFSAAFAECGFRREAFFPCYGLAEATLFVTGPAAGSPLKFRPAITPAEDSAKSITAITAEQSKPLVGCGKGWTDHEVTIVDPVSRQACAEGHVGEIWVAGPSIARGYWNQPEESEATFRAYLNSSLSLGREGWGEKESIVKTFLRTGDLGFLYQGELYVTGRIKDLIIMRGLNYYPQDLEQALDEHVEALRPGCTVAFSVLLENEEHLVIVAEVRRPSLTEEEAQPIFDAMRQALVNACDAPIHAMVLVPPGAVPKTSSGKIQRRACKEAYLGNRLKILARSDAQTDVKPPLGLPLGKGEIERGWSLLRDAFKGLPAEQRVPFLARFLATKIVQLLKIPETSLTPTQPLCSLGLSSLQAVELKHAAETLLGTEAPVTIFLSDHALVQVAELLASNATGYWRLEAGEKRTQACSLQPLALSYAQQAIWTVQQMEPGSIAYNLHLAFRIDGPVDPGLLAQALEHLVERHAVLRTVYRSEGDAVTQSIVPPPAVSEYFSVVKATAWSESVLQEDLGRRARMPFDLASGPVLRVTLYRQDPNPFTLLCCAHHIAVDLWSLLIFLKELKATYEALARGCDPLLPPLPADYQDFIAGQTSYLAGPANEKAWEYWRTQLSGELPVLGLPADYPRLKAPSYQGASVPLRLNKDTTTRLKGFAKRYGVTLFTLLLAAYKVLLHRYTRQKDLIVGVPSSGRVHGRFASLAGLFVNPLPLRSHPCGDKPFSSYLAEVHEALLGALEHQDFPFSLMVERLQPERTSDHWPIYQTLFVLQEAQSGIDGELAQLALGEDGPPMVWGNWVVQPVAIRERVENFDLKLMAAECARSLLFSFQYRTDLFDRYTIARLSSHLERLLAGIVADPDVRLGELSLLTESERQQLLHDWNATQRSYPSHKCIQELFEAQAARQPEALAVVCGEQTLSYGELNACANRLAHYLRARGVGPEMRVGLCVERSFHLIVGMLGILKAGGAYVPLDPAYPKEWLAEVLADCGTSVLLIQERLLEELSPSDTDVLCFDQDWPRIAAQPADNLSALGHPLNAAYLIYTSGSTGKPKGVVVSHRNAVASTVARSGFYWEAVDGFLLLSSFAFDSSVAGIFWTLSQGGRLCIPPEGNHQDPLFLAELIAQERLTHLLCLPSLYSLLLEGAALGQLDPLSTVIVAGEACLPAIAVKHFSRLPRVKLYNEYGPTEGTVWSSVYEIQLADAQGEKPIPIGRPIASTQIYLLDTRLNPVPVGVPGELYLGGAGVARGYHERPALTAERFVPSPFGDEPGTRLYETGDLACCRPDGNIEFLGRVDHQVKIRGFRIELSEIETRLLRHPQVEDSVVIAREDSPGDRRLVAYWIPSKDGGRAENLTTSEILRAFLKERLPEHMVPAAFVRLEALPLTPNGKVDRKALPVPDWSGQLAHQYVAPRNLTEERLAQLWVQVLRVERVGIHDNFFALGGDSILAIQVASRARQAGTHLTPRELFQHQTVAELAMVAAQAVRNPIEPGSISGDVPLTPIQAWFFEQHVPNPHHWNQAVLLEVPSALDPALLHQAIDHLLVHHDALRLRFVQEDAGWRQYYAQTETHSLFYCEDLSGILDEDLAKVIEARSGWWQTQLDLAEGPLLQVVLFDLGRHRPCRLLIVLHHLVVDGVSWRILLDDLHVAYHQLVQGQTVRLPPKSASFKHWAEQLQTLAQSKALREEAAYWLDATAADMAPLPVDNGGVVRDEHYAATITVELSEAETQSLCRGAPAAYHTGIEDLLLTALAQTLGAWSGSDSVVIDWEGHGREELFEDLDLSRTVGWFTRVCPVRLHLPKDAPPVAAICAVKEQLRRIPRKGIGYGLLRYLSRSEVGERLKGRRTPSVLFNYLGQLDQSLQSTAFVLARESTGPCYDPNGERVYELEINACVIAARLRIEWRYGGMRYRQATVVSLVEQYLTALRVLINHCLSPEAGSFTPTDFPLATLTQGELDALACDPRIIEDVYPLSPMQEGMLFHTLMGPHSGIYLMQDRFDIQGLVDVAAFRDAWQTIVDRHPALRVSFVWDTASRPHQLVHREVLLPFEYLDWRGFDEAERRTRLDRLLQEELEQGVDLSRPPLMRIRLLRLGENRYRFVRSYHHILIDAWCTSLILTELKAHYAALLRDQSLVLPSPPPFRAYLAWLARQDEIAAERFWQKTLQGYTEPTPLPLAAPHREQEEGVADAVARLGEEDTRELLALAHRHRLTPNTLVQAAWALTLVHYSGRDDVLFGITVAGRPTDLSGSEQMLGVFINSLPLRVAPKPDQREVEFLAALLAQNLEMRRYEYLPLLRIQALSAVPRERALFDSLLVFENYPIDPSLHHDDGGLYLTGVEVRTHTNYPLTVTVVPGAQLNITITYQRERYDRTAIESLLESFRHLLKVVVRYPDARLSEIPFLTEAERRRIEDWNRTESAWKELRDFVTRFEAQASRTPDNIAAACGRQEITYAALAARAGRIASRLRSHSVGPETLVAVLDERGLDSLAAILGIFKAGGAYLPLDPAHPDARLWEVLEDAEPALLLAGAHQTARAARIVEGLAGLRAISLTELEQSAGLADTPRGGESHLAYVMYTSGSTGRPKGVMVERAGMRNNLLSKIPALGLTASDVVAQTASQCFDISVWQFLTPLLCGAQVRIFPDAVAHDPWPLLEQVEHYGVTVLESVPSLIRAMLDLPATPLTGLRWLLPTGEALPPELCRRWQERYPQVALLNAYGPAECSDDVAYYPVPKGYAETALTVPIGRPVDNMRLYLLGRWLNPAPVGSPGEICVAGIQVGRGYLHRPDLTAAAFIPDPFSDLGERLYRTGDLGCYRADGTIEYLGRIDHQVKVRGFRIEPGEIEARLRQHPSVREAVVIARADTAVASRLVAYFTPIPERKEDNVTIHEVLRAFLKETLPDYMVPAAFVMLEKLPVTPNGKMDRKALPEPETVVQSQDQYVAPKNPTEEILADIWHGVLGVGRVGIRDNFFDLGGHSLSAVRVLSRVRTAFGVDIPLRRLFETTTIEQLAVVIEELLIEQMEGLSDAEAQMLLTEEMETQQS